MMQRITNVVVPFFALLAMVSFSACSSPTQGASAPIGNDGGTIITPGGTEITIPAGAIDGNVTIKINPVNIQVGEVSKVSEVFKFEPEGQVFNKPVTVTIPITSASTANLVAFWSKQGDPSSYDEILGTIEGNSYKAEVTHFSYGFIGVSTVKEPSISEFKSGKSTISVGSSTTLTAVFSDGTGQIDNGIGSITSSVPVTINPASTTAYTLTVTNSLGKKATAQTTVTVVPKPVVTSFVAAASSITAGESTSITAVFTDGNGVVDSSIGAITSGIAKTVTPASTTTYTLTVTNAAGDTDTETVTVTVVPAPVISSFTATSNIITTGGSTDLLPVFSGGAGVIEPDVGVVTSEVAASTGSLSATATYTLTVTNSLGSTATSSLTITVVPPPVITSFLAGSPSITATESTTLTGIFTGGVGVVNQSVGTVTTGQVKTVTPASTTTYTLTVTNAAGDSDTETATVTVVPKPVISSFTAGSYTISAGHSTSLTAIFTGSAAGTGTIDNSVGVVSSNTPVTISPITTTTYTLTVKNSLEYPVTSQVTVTVVPHPEITSFTATPASITATENSTLTGVFTGGVGTVNHDVGTITSTVAKTVTPASTTTYTLTVTNAAGDTDTETATVTVVPKPAISDFTALNPTISVGHSTSLTAIFTGSAAGTGTIDNSVGVVSSNTPVTVSPITTTTYTLTVKNSLEYPVTSQVTVTVVPHPEITSFTATPASITATENSTLTGIFTGGVGTVNHDVGTITSTVAKTVTPASTTTYTLTVTNAAGDVEAETATVTVIPKPAISGFTALNPTISVGHSTSLTALFTGSADGNGTIDNGVGTVTNSVPVSVSPTTTTTYTLTVLNSLGYPATSQVTVTVVPHPEITSFTATPTSITATESATLTGIFTGGVGVVNQSVGTVTTGQEKTVTPASTTTYILTVTNAAGDTDTESATVTVIPKPVITSFTAGRNTITSGDSTELLAVFSGDGVGTVTPNVGVVQSGTPKTTGTLTETTTFVLTVTNSLGYPVTDSITVTVVDPPVITSFIAASYSVPSGGSTTLTGVFTGGNGTVDHSVGSVNNNVAKSTGTLTTTTTFTLTVTNPANDTDTASLTVTVAAPVTYSLTLTIQGNGTINVQGTDYRQGITLTFPQGTNVNMNAIPDLGWVFDRWSGSQNSPSPFMSIVMNSDKTENAKFNSTGPQPDGGTPQDAGQDAGSQDAGSDGGCVIPATQCGIDYDNHNRAVCGALQITLSGGTGQDAGSDIIVQTGTSAWDSYCQDGASYSNWFKVTVPAKTLIYFWPNTDDRTSEFSFKIYTGPSSAQSLGELTDVTTNFTSPGEQARWKYTFAGTGNVYVYIAVNGVTPGYLNYKMIVDVTDRTYDVVDMRLTGRGDEYYGNSFIGGLKNWDSTANHDYDEDKTTQACLKTLDHYADGGTPIYSEMKVVRAVNGALVTAYDCKNDFPNWTPELAAHYGELLCDYNSHPGDQLWCEPSGWHTVGYMGVCELQQVTRGRSKCIEDPVNHEKRYTFYCTTNDGWIFDSNPTLYNPYHTTEDGGYNGGYFGGVDCKSPYSQGTERAYTDFEADAGVCGTYALTGGEGCLHFREQFTNLETPEPNPYPTTLDKNNFPYTQNLVGGIYPGEGNNIPYVLLDPVSGILTDEDVAESAPLFTAWLARGLQKVLAYFPWGGVSGRTIDSAKWYTLGFWYGYWNNKLWSDIGVSKPSGFEVFSNLCWDSDGDGIDNLSDTCPEIYNPDQADADYDCLGDPCDPTPYEYDEDPDHDGLNACQNSTTHQSDDNCPLVYNPKAEGAARQVDTDNNGIGDACQTTAVCVPTTTISCLDEQGHSHSTTPMIWGWDVNRNSARELLFALYKLNALAGQNGITFDNVSAGNCFADETITRFRTYLTNRGSLYESLVGSVDPNNQARIRAAEAAIAAIGGEGAIGSFDVRTWFTNSVCTGPDAGCRFWELYKIDVMRDFMRELRDEMEAFSAVHGLAEYITFYNQMQMGLQNICETETVGEVDLKLKSIPGAETYLYSGHPTLGYNDCVGETDPVSHDTGGTSYPISKTLQMTYSLHDTDGMRFWSWNGPSTVPDDRMLLFHAEAIANGGIPQFLSDANDFLYPYGGYSSPKVTARLAQAAIGPWMTKQWNYLSHPRMKGQIAFYSPQTVSCGSASYAERLLYEGMLSLHYTADVLGRGPFYFGKSRLPTVEELRQYDFIVLASTILSDEEITVFEAYVAGDAEHAGGKVLVMGTNAGSYDEWCVYKSSRSTWRSHFSNFGKTTYGSYGGYFVQISSDAHKTWGNKNAYDAFATLASPNEGYIKCLNPDGSIYAESGTQVSTNVASDRATLYDFLQANMSTLPAADFGSGLPYDVHITARYNESNANKPIYHFVNYALTAVPFDHFYYGHRAGADQYLELRTDFGCSTIQTLDTFTIPIPASLQGTAGSVTVVSLDYNADYTSPMPYPFYPSTTYPGSPCATEPLYGPYPSSPDWIYPSWSFEYGISDTVVTISGVKMKQWMIVAFN